MPGPEAWGTERVDLLPETREFLRGVASVLHNNAIALKEVGEREASFQKSKLSEQLCLGLGDEYRVAQARHHQAMILFERGDLDGAQERLLKVLGSRWRRGQRIARQWLARVAGRSGRIAPAIQSFEELVRYFIEGERLGQRNAERRLRAYVFRRGSVSISRPMDLKGLLTKKWDFDHGPSPDLARSMFKVLLEPIWEDLDVTPGKTRLVLIPTDELLALPLHAALVEIAGEEMPLAAAFPLCLSVSATAHIERGRHLLARFPVEHDDDLFAVTDVDRRASGAELLGLGWDPRFFQIAGRAPERLAPVAFTAVRPGLAALDKLAKVKPEFFLYAGHGRYDRKRESIGPVLTFGDLRLTQYDVAQRVRLPRNKLTLLAACVSGLGVASDGGEVAGFLRAFMAAGSGAIGLTLWEVLDREIAHTVGGLLREVSRLKGERASVFDVVERLHALYAERCQSHADSAARIEACPCALYL